MASIEARLDAIEAKVGATSRPLVVWHDVPAEAVEAMRREKAALAGVRLAAVDVVTVRWADE